MKSANAHPDPWHEDGEPAPVAGEVVAVGNLKVITLPVQTPRQELACKIAGRLIGIAIFGGLIPAVYWSVVWSCRAMRWAARRLKR